MTQKKRNNNFQRKFNPERQHERPKAPMPPRGYNVLPAPGILESYEELATGAAGIIIEMARLEQVQRHKWENKQLRYAAYITKLGQLLAFMLGIIITYAFISMVVDAQYMMAGVIAFSGFGYLTFVTAMSYNSRKFSRPHRRIEEERSAS